jgi:hypothetical protein
MRKTLTTILAVALFGILAAVVVAQVREDTPPSGTTATTEDNPGRIGTDAPVTGEISGPCDEAEHAGDPRCTGAGEVEHRADDDRVDDDRFDDDREHDNSGPGSVSSGHNKADDHDDLTGFGGDDVDDDHSGLSGHGGDDDDSSGPGGGGSSGHGGGGGD